MLGSMEQCAAFIGWKHRAHAIVTIVTSTQNRRHMLTSGAGRVTEEVPKKGDLAHCLPEYRLDWTTQAIGQQHTI